LVLLFGWFFVSLFVISALFPLLSSPLSIRYLSFFSVSFSPAPLSYHPAGGERLREREPGGEHEQRAAQQDGAHVRAQVAAQLAQRLAGRQDGRGRGGRLG